jgi:hypothetical protein
MQTIQTGRLNNTLYIEDIGEEMLKFLESNENENTIHQNLWDKAKAILRGL